MANALTKRRQIAAGYVSPSQLKKIQDAARRQQAVAVSSAKRQASAGLDDKLTDLEERVASIEALLVE